MWMQYTPVPSRRQRAAASIHQSLLPPAQLCWLLAAQLQICIRWQPQCGAKRGTTLKIQVDKIQTDNFSYSKKNKKNKK